jgi:hypothetical protein
MKQLILAVLFTLSTSNVYADRSFVEKYNALLIDFCAGSGIPTYAEVLPVHGKRNVYANTKSTVSTVYIGNKTCLVLDVSDTDTVVFALYAYFGVLGSADTLQEAAQRYMVDLQFAMNNLAKGADEQSIGSVTLKRMQDMLIVCE